MLNIAPKTYLISKNYNVFSFGLGAQITRKKYLKCRIEVKLKKIINLLDRFSILRQRNISYQKTILYFLFDEVLNIAPKKYLISKLGR